MHPSALLLTEENLSHQDRCIAKVLDFFGIASRTASVAEFRSKRISDVGKPRLLCSADVFLKVLGADGRSPDDKPTWWDRLHSVFIYADPEFQALERLARFLTGDNGSRLQEIDRGAGSLEVSKEWNEFCRVMAGVRVPASRPNIAASRVLRSSRTTPIIGLDGGAVFLKIDYQGVPICLSTSKRIINLDAKPGSRNFDVRDYFMAAVPLVLYVKWAFAEVCWNAPEINSCLIIDDPLLKPSYGCMNFNKLLALMERYQFSTNIAFIPWNWRRSKPGVAALFRQWPDRYSLSVHGSDHIAQEFGSSDRERLRWKATEAIDRMARHENSTGIAYDRVMVFPQGVFSQAAMDVLKRANFTAAVNSEILSFDPHPDGIRISDLWDIAIMRYGCFPMFTRRDPTHDIANFAFDILLGKSCLIGLHHDFCRHRYKHLIDFVNHLKSLNCQLSWRSLGEAVKRSYRQRTLGPDALEIEMYAAELVLENSTDQHKRVLVRRREEDASAIKEVRDGTRAIPWSAANDQIHFETELSPGELKALSVRFHEPAGNGHARADKIYRFRTMMRRYLSEARDNHFSKRSMGFRP